MPPAEPQPPFPDWPRYAPGRVLPPYRFVPGLNPHPVSDPAGHSHGRRTERVDLPAPEGWAGSEPYRHAVDLHNFAYWWEAHEAWEGLWQLTDRRSPQAQFLQGLIQVSAGLLKAHLGQREGAETLLTEASARLRRIPGPRYMGVDLPGHLAQVACCLDDLKRSTALPAGHLPMIRLS